jgi:predicted transcriptional regulator
MSTTSIKISAELKARASAAAEQRGISTHAFLIEAIEQAATAAEQRASFVEDALKARAQMLRSGRGYDFTEVFAYLNERIAGQESAKPKAKSWRR